MPVVTVLSFILKWAKIKILAKLKVDNFTDSFFVMPNFDTEENKIMIEPKLQ